MSAIENHGPVRQREPRERDRVYLGRVARLPCVCCLVRKGHFSGPGVHVAHVRTSFPEEGWRWVGKAEKPHDWRTLPLCPGCHMYAPHAQHRGNEGEFWERLFIYPPAICAALRQAFSVGEDGQRVVDKFVDNARRGCMLGAPDASNAP